MIFIINNACNRRCSYCFEGDKLDNPGIMTPRDVKEILEFSKSDGTEEPQNSSHSIMGGEPTLNPHFGDILNLINKYSHKKSLILTNGTGDPKTSHMIGNKNFRVLVHINISDPYTDDEINKIVKNLQILSQYTKPSLSITLTSLEDKLDTMFDIIKLSKTQSRIGAVRIGISSPGYKFENLFSHQFNIKWGKKYIDTVFKVKKINESIIINNECAVNMCMMDFNTYNILSRTVNNMKNVCGGGNFDIFPDFSSHYCYACDSIPELRIDNIFDYVDAKDLITELNRRAEEFDEKLGILDGCRTCSLINKIEGIGCNGPCIAYKFFMKNILNDTNR